MLKTPPSQVNEAGGGATSCVVCLERPRMVMGGQIWVK